MTLEELKIIKKVIEIAEMEGWLGSTETEEASKIIEREIKLKEMDPRKRNE